MVGAALRHDRRLSAAGLILGCFMPQWNYLVFEPWKSCLTRGHVVPGWQADLVGGKCLSAVQELKKTHKVK